MPKQSKKNKSTSTGLLKILLASPFLRQLGASVLLVLFAGVAAGLAWQQFSPMVLEKSQYWVTAQGVQISPLPHWIHRDLKSEVFRDARLQFPMPLADPELNRTLASAFAMHPWVKAVVKVEKSYPGRVRVQLRYRRPVCMVHVSGGLLPVDEQGTLLPTEDFTPVEAATYPRVEGVNALPAVPPGVVWADARVVGAAAIVDLLGERWQTFKLEVVRALVPNDGTKQPVFELVTKAGTRVFWGHAPGAEMPGEATAAQKLARLVVIWQKYGTLDHDQKPRVWDIHMADRF